jgi:hypothetical protein
MDQPTEIRKTLYMAGDLVPRYWFKVLDNVESVTFTHPCIVEETETKRTIRKVQPVIAGPIIFFTHFKDSDGVMKAHFDRKTLVNSIDETIAMLSWPNQPAASLVEECLPELSSQPHQPKSEKS